MPFFIISGLFEREIVFQNCILELKKTLLRDILFLLASYEEVSGNDYNLSVSACVAAEDTREKIDIVKPNAEIKAIVAREQMNDKGFLKLINGQEEMIWHQQKSIWILSWNKYHRWMKSEAGQ